MTQQDQEQEGSTMVDQQQDQEKKGPTMERRKTMTMTWEGLGDDDDDAFFETRDRLSTAVPIDLLSSEDDDEDYDDSRASFASAMSAMDDFQRTSFEEAVRQAPVATMFGNYDMWMAEPGSIKDRRKKLLQGMGLASNKNLLSTKFMHVVSEKIAANAAADQPPKTATAATAKAAPPSTTAAPPESASPPDGSKQEVLTAMPRVMLVRSRSDGDIETFSAQTRRRKEELIGNVSKQRLTRTSSVLLTSQAGICLYANAVNVEPKSSARNRSSIPNSAALLDTQFGAFFLIKNLDTGKEFIVKEFNNDGMWNRLSEVQTGKQLTMEEFEKSVGYSPVVKELMRRAHVDEVRKGNVNSYLSKSFRYSKKRGVSLLKNIKGVATSVSGLIAEKEREQQLQQQQQSSSPDKKNNKNSSSSSSSKWVKVRTHGKSIKDFSALHLCQEIQAHEGSIWTMKFSPDAHYLATAGEDRVIHVWEVQECDVMQANDLSSAGSTPIHPMVAGGSNSMDHRPNLGDASPLPSEKRKDRPPLPELSPMLSDKKRKGKFSNKKKGIPDYVHVPETVFSLSEKPICTFTGHQDDVLDLSWSKSQLLLSASMDKTVRLWDMETKSCLKLFAHNDYVTCIQFNPVDDDYFISGSLDEKVRIWSIPDRQLIDYTDLHEMVTSACYTPDGQGAIIGSHKGSCRLYSTAECRIEHKEQFELRRKKKSMLRKVTGFQYSPSNPSEILVTSADSRIRILDGSEIIHKFKGFKNTSSQISASFSADGKHVISASEDSQVYIWKREGASGKGKGMITTQSHEHFQCKDVSVAIPWNGHVRGEPPVVEIHSKRHSKRSIPLPPSSIGSPTPDESGSKRLLPPLPKKNSMLERSTSCHEDDPSHISRTDSDSAIGAGDSFSSSSSSMRFGESPSISASASSSSQSWSSRFEGGSGHGGAHTVQATAWGLVIVTAGMEGEIRAYQNFGLPIKVGRL